MTFLLTDVVGSSSHWERNPEHMAECLGEHDKVVGTVVSESHGLLLKAKGEGDSTFSVFHRASDAAFAAIRLQELIEREEWAGPLALRLRISVATGEALERDGDYFGPTVNRAARLRSLASSNQILVNEACARLAADGLPSGTLLVDLGMQRLAGHDREERVFELRATGGEAVNGSATANLEARIPSAIASVEQSVFVGRVAELDRAANAWRDARSGSGRQLLVSGEPGIGKTRFAARIGASCAADGAVVLYGKCDDHLRVPFAPFGEALHSGGTDLATVGDLLAPQSTLHARTHDESQRRALFDAVLKSLSEWASRVPIVLILDDLQWAGMPAAALLRHIARSLQGTPVFIIGTYRDTDTADDSPLSLVLPDLLALANSERLSLSGLFEEDVQQLVAHSVGGTQVGDSSTLADAVFSETSGNPLFVLETLRDPSALDRSEARTLPESVMAAIDQRLKAVSDDAKRVLPVAAVAGDRFSFGLLERVPDAADRAERLLDALDELVRARLVLDEPQGYTFAHDLVRQAVLARLSSARRMRLHRHLGEAREGTPALADVNALAFHYAGAAGDGLAGKALQYGHVAAKHALERLAFEEAISHAERALAVTEDLLDAAPDARAEVRLDFVEALISLGRRPEAREELRIAIDDARRGAAPLLLARAATLSHDWANYVPVAVNPSVIALCREALDAIGEDQPFWRARILAQLARSLASVGEEGQDAIPLAEEAIAIARATARPVLGEALRAKGLALYGTPLLSDRETNAREMMEQGAATEDRLLEGEGMLWLASAAFDAGDRESFDVFVEAAERQGESAQAWTLSVRSLWMRVTQAMLDGDFEEVEFRWTKLRDTYGHDPTIAVAVLPTQMYFLRRAQGRHDELLPTVRAVAEANPGLLKTWGAVMASGLLDAGDTRGAREQLARQRVNEGFDLPRDAGRPIALAFLIDCAARLGLENEIELLMDQFLPYGGQMVTVGAAVATGGAADRFIGMGLAALGRHDEASGRFDSAARLERGLGSRWLADETRHWQRRLGASGRRRPKTKAVRAATGWESLSDAEQRVAVFVADGLTNRQIAERLFVSPHTVDTHIRHVFHKLGASKRAEVAGIVARLQS